MLFVAPQTAEAGQHMAFSSGASSNLEEKRQHLVLVGGGHAHVQVIKALRARPNHLKVTLIDQLASASYSGMVPGSIAGAYKTKETLIHLRPLAEWAGIQFIQDKVVDIDLDSKNISLQAEAAPEPFDVISVDIGSTSSGLDLVPGAREFSIPTRPIHKLVESLEQARVELRNSRDLVHLVVVGAGTAGIELALATTGRWRRDGIPYRCTLLDSRDGLLPNESTDGRAMMKRVLEEANIQVRHNSKVESMTQKKITIKCEGNAEEIEFSTCVWATGAGSHALPLVLSRKQGLAASKDGFIEVNSKLQSTTHPFVFAAGDCVNIHAGNKRVPKAGVYAVRAGPVLIENLIRQLDCMRNCDSISGAQLTEYQPQDDVLKLLVCGDGKALGFRFGITFYGKWVFQMKDAIDRQFLRLFDSRHLPNHRGTAGQYDLSQYDASSDVEEQPQLSALEAASLIERTDDGVDFKLAWSVLRRMASDVAFRDEVLRVVQTDARASEL